MRYEQQTHSRWIRHRRRALYDRVSGCAPRGGAGPELQTARLQLAYHLAAELLTALVLLVTGVGMVYDHHWAGRGFLVALGMLLYTVINSAGYYAELGEIAMVGLFACLTVTTPGCLWIGLTHPRVLSVDQF